MGLFVVFTMSKIPKFFCNVSCNVMDFAPCTIFTIATPDNCSGNGAAIFTYLLLPGFRVNDSSGKMGMALFRNLNSECLALCSPSTSCMFFIPKTRSISSCISDTKVNIFKSMVSNAYYYWNYKKSSNSVAITYLQTFDVCIIFR